MILSGSLLNADQVRLAECIAQAEAGGVDELHLDATNGVYVRNISFGPQTVSDIKAVTRLPLDVHLELDNTLDMIEIYGPAAPECITVQADCCPLPLATFRRIRSFGARVGLAINACDSVERYGYYLPYIDELLIMSVEPGFGGQPFAPHTFDKITQAQALMKRHGVDIPIGVDGGVDIETGKKLLKAGVKKLVVGSAIFRNGNIENSARLMKSELSAGRE